ncbi:hypothetical protein Pan216_29010 [Planctomycetes bacterium Pan216]|uniref:HEAT repeat protein n=1 Tax=Kolteria novifilia TaxID=2527975 RepID=A0A518B4Y3_9BACT|nr:hypothetical protein Pan216_29010 [Planctomycetes bacterium Pan216]
MMRKALLAAALCLVTTLPTYAQEQAVAGATTVNVSKKCCSIFDFLGIGQAFDFINENIFKSALGQAANRVLGPVGRALGLGPSLLSDKFANEPGAMGLAHKLKKEELKAPLKVKAIEYLGTLDCNCYPEVVDALLASLDDCTEVVRFAALKALRKQCGKKHFSHLHGHKQSCECESECRCDCRGCQCQRKVIERLNDLLLERDETGCLKEKSHRVRELATIMIEECLSKRQPPPGMCMDEPAEEVKPAPEKKPTPDPVPKAKPDVAPKAVPDTTTTNSPSSLGSWLRSWSRASKSDEPAEQVTETVSHEVVQETPAPTATAVTHTAGYRGVPREPVEAAVETRVETRVEEPLVSEVIEEEYVPARHRRGSARPRFGKRTFGSRCRACERREKLAEVETDEAAPRVSGEVALITAEVVAEEGIVIESPERQAKQSGSPKSRRHLLGEIFGY